jgi:hypothetical protein
MQLAEREGRITLRRTGHASIQALKTQGAFDAIGVVRHAGQNTDVIIMSAS